MLIGMGVPDPNVIEGYQKLKGYNEKGSFRLAKIPKWQQERIKQQGGAV